MRAVVQHCPPAERPGNRFDHGVVDSLAGRCPSIGCAVGCEDELPAAARYWLIATLIASAVRSASAAMVRVGLAVPDVGKREEPANQRLGWSWLRPARVRDRCLAICAHPGGAHDVAGAFRVGNVPDLGRAEREIAAREFCGPPPTRPRYNHPTGRKRGAWERRSRRADRSPALFGCGDRAVAQ